MPDFYEFFAGGGMARAGLGPDWNCLLANDICTKKAASYAANWGRDHLVVRDVNKLALEAIPGHADMAWASFPCQDLSLAGTGSGLEGERSGTFWGFWNIVRGLARQSRKPRMILLENVYGAITSHDGNDFLSIMKTIAAEGYRIGAMVIDAVHFVPQSRQRLFILGIDHNMNIPQEIVADTPSPAWHPASLIRAYNRLPRGMQRQWRWWSLSAPNLPQQVLEDLIEEYPAGVAWHTTGETRKLLSMMTDINRRKVIEAQGPGRVRVGTLYKRTRNGVQRAEVRFDGIAGCLRTPAGGSSRQTIIIVDGANVRTRLLSPREAARLMGLPDFYRLPDRYNDAYRLAGDGVVVPVVSHLAKHLLAPVLKLNPRAEWDQAA